VYEKNDVRTTGDNAEARSNDLANTKHAAGILKAATFSRQAYVPVFRLTPYVHMLMQGYTQITKRTIHSPTYDIFIRKLHSLTFNLIHHRNYYYYVKDKQKH
jgi:hypothetical protein